MDYSVIISPIMKEVCQWLQERCIGMNNCIYSLGRNLVVEVAKSDCENAVIVLKERFQDVVLITKAYSMLDDLHDFILVKQMISESPVFVTEDVTIPVLEKHLVDLATDKMYEGKDHNQVILEMQRAFETYDVNRSKMIRYASRKGKKEEIIDMIATLDENRIATVKAVQEYLKGTPFEKVWMFGSFSRMEDRPDSDLDLLAELEDSKNLGLMELSGIVLGLEKVSNKRIDLIMERAIKPFARESIENDKVLIYERGR